MEIEINIRIVIPTAAVPAFLVRSGGGVGITLADVLLTLFIEYPIETF